MSEPRETDVRRDDRPGEEREEEREAEPRVPEAAPTDFRGNLWVLLTILGVVVLAWAVSLLSSTNSGHEPPGEPGQHPPGSATGRPGAASPLSPSGAVRRQRTFIPPAAPRPGAIGSSRRRNLR